MKKILGNPNQTNKKLIDIINKIKINDFYLKNQKDFINIKKLVQKI